MSPVYNIWEEGYALTGERSKAHCVARNVEAPNFAEACRQICGPRDPGRYGEFDPEELTVWGLRLFPDETEARKSFG